MPTTTTSRLTPRQREILELMAEGRTAGEIARALGLSRFTIKNYTERMFARLDVYSRAGAVGRALREGLLD